MKTFVRYGTDHDIETHVMHPGPIDNLPIMIEEEEEEEKEEEEEEEKMSSFAPLRPRLVRKDFVVVPSEAWTLLRKWYGLDSQSREFRREVFRSSWGSKAMRKPFVDLYPLFVTLAYAPIEGSKKRDPESKNKVFLRKRIRVSSRISIDQLRFRLGPREYKLPSIGQDLQHLQFGFARIKEGELFYDEDSGFSDSKKSLEDLGVSSGDILAIWKREVVNDESPRKRFRRTVLYFAPRQADEEGVPSGRPVVADFTI